ncbi:hypothetical protein KM043_012092 [Ampulex compressa]|nr:hypothetical protein KM043_012092 [Ampulex compressa]
MQRCRETERRRVQREGSEDSWTGGRLERRGRKGANGSTREVFLEATSFCDFSSGGARSLRVAHEARKALAEAKGGEGRRRAARLGEAGRRGGGRMEDGGAKGGSRRSSRESEAEGRGRCGFGGGRVAMAATPAGQQPPVLPRRSPSAQRLRSLLRLAANVFLGCDIPRGSFGFGDESGDKRTVPRRWLETENVIARARERGRKKKASRGPGVPILAVLRSDRPFVYVRASPGPWPKRRKLAGVGSPGARIGTARISLEDRLYLRAALSTCRRSSMGDELV